jgi:hypothetical protein
MTGNVIAVLGVLLQLLTLFWRPVIRYIDSHEKSFRTFLVVVISLRLIWVLFAYWSIWYEFQHPDEWDLDLPGSALIAYAAIFPVLILAFDWLIFRIISIALALFT